METSFSTILKLISLIFFIFSNATYADDSVSLRILHFNDLYEVAPKTDPLGQKYGGLAELKTLIDQKKTEVENSLVTFGGDMQPATLEGFHLSSEEKIKLMNVLGIDAAVLGNHEFDYGAEAALTLIKLSNFPWIVDNIEYKGKEGFGTTLPYKVFTFKDYKIAFIGLILPETKIVSSPGPDINFTAAALKAKPLVLKLKKEGVDVIIALTHQTLAEDEQLLKSVKEIDLILGGHEHRPITYFTNQRKMIFKTGYDATYLGLLDLKMERYHNKDGQHIYLIHSWQMIPVRNFEPNPLLYKLINELKSKTPTSYYKPIATLEVDLDSRRSAVDSKQTSMGSLIANSFRDELAADIAVINGGAIRGDRLYPMGTTLSRQNIMQELPFKDHGVVRNITGAELKQWLENGLLSLDDPTGSFLQISGFKFTYNPKAPKGNRVQEILIGNQPIDMNKAYRIATITYLANGKSGYPELSPIGGKNSKLMSSEIVIQHLEKLKTITKEHIQLPLIQEIQE